MTQICLCVGCELDRKLNRFNVTSIELGVLAYHTCRYRRRRHLCYHYYRPPPRSNKQITSDKTTGKNFCHARKM